MLEKSTTDMDNDPTSSERDSIEPPPPPGGGDEVDGNVTGEEDVNDYADDDIFDESLPFGNEGC
jgi:hypothetical protein